MAVPSRTSVVAFFALLLSCPISLRANDVAFPELDKTGAALIDKGDLAKAEEFYHGALEQARLAGDKNWTAEFLRRLGEVRQRSKDWKGALAWYEQSLPIRQELGQKPETAYLLLGTGWAKMQLDEASEAEPRLESSRALYRELGDKAKEALALGLLEQIAVSQHDFDKADSQYRELLTLYEERHDAGGIVATRASRASLFFQRSQYRNSLSEGFAAIDAARPAVKDLPNGDVRRNLLTNEANAMEAVGNTYQKMVQLPRALDYYQQALRIRQDLHDDERAASVWSNMAPVLTAMGKTEEAIGDLEQALKVRRGIGNKGNIASTLMALGEAYLAQGKLEAARQRYQEALPLSVAGSASQGVALYQLGNIALDAGQMDDALSFHKQALEVRQKARNPHDVVRSWSQIAAVLEKRGELADAAAAHIQAMDGFEKLTLEVSDPVQLASFRETAARLYPSYARILFKQGKLTDALLIAERGRGQALARLSGNDRAGFRDLLTSAERTAWDDATGSLAKAANRFRIALERQASDQQVAERNAAWLDAKAALSQTRERIFTENLQLQSKQTAAQPELPSLLELSRRNPRTIYLEWLAVDNASTLLFSLSSGKTSAYLLPAGSSEIRGLVSGWRGALVREQGRGIRILPDGDAPVLPEPELARRLYKVAMGPLANSLESGAWDRMVAVTDGPLLDAPLAALITNRGKRLVERFAISTAVSLHSLLAPDDRRAAASSLLVIGDPSEPGQERAVIPSGGRVAPLERARAEAQGLAAKFSGSVNLSGADARESQVKRRLDCCSILHFATHGLLDPEAGMDSGLLLAAEPEGSSEDGVLQAWEIAEMRLNAKLVVLSACDSARGDRSLGEGLIGLAWAFLASGSPTVVASLWSVDDDATADLMEAFYTALKSGTRSDVAMQQAMLKLQKRTTARSPYFWAAFSVIGQSNPI